MRPAIEAQHLSKSSRGQRVVDDPTFHAKSRPSVAAPPRARRRRARAVVAALAALLLVSVAVEFALAARDAQRFPPPGQLVEVAEGRTLHLDVTARGTGGPTVLLESGAGLPSSLWDSTIEAVLAMVEGPVTVVAYDRAGTAWSGPASTAPTPDAVIADLRAALSAHGLEGPYVLVGHSIGGHYVRAFAGAHPDEVSGLVLVDPRHEGAAARVPELLEAQEATTRMLRWGVRLRPFGVTRLMHQASDQLPGDVAAEVYALGLNRHHLRGSLALGEALDDIDAHVAQHASDLGDIPVRVLSAGQYPAGDALAGTVAEVLDDLHESMTSLSSDATRHVVDGGDHISILTDPANASQLSRHIHELVTSR